MPQQLCPSLLLLLLAIACGRRMDERSNSSASASVEPSSPAPTATLGAAGAPSTQAATAEPEEPSSALRWSEASLAKRPLPTDGQRVYAKTRHVWIYAELDATKQWIGYLWSGSSVRLRSPKPKYGIGCGEFFYAIEPRGYVCTDGGRVTTDPTDPVVEALFPYAPRADSPWPHRYGESRGAPLYFSLPDPPEQHQREPALKRHLELVESARATGQATGSLLGVDLTPAPEGVLAFPKLSPSVREAHSLLKPRSTVAYTTELRHAGRDFLLTADYRFIPKDRVVPYPASHFKGLRLGVDATLPLAFFRQDGVVRYRQTADGSFESHGPAFERLSHVGLTGKSARTDNGEYLETTESDWLERSSAVLPTPASMTPWDATVGQPDSSALRPKGRATWIEVSIRGGWLIAYDDTTPTFVTLISPGRGGEPRPGRDPLETSATPLGRFSITGKFVTSTMVAPNDYLHSDVPFAQNFSGPYALHAAYWHDNWGNLMSGGCINLSPIDALFMFNWTEPPAPQGWHGTRWLPYLEPATTLVIHR